MRRLPSLPALRAFEAAARLGSFAAAAAELNLTPSAISHQVHALESWFERALFVRSVRRVELTDAGRRLLPGLTQAFDLLHESCAELRAPGQRRELAIHCSPSFASKWLSPRLAQFMQAHPAITPLLTSDAEPPDLHRHDDLDVAITYGRPVERADVELQALGAEPTVPMCSPRLLPDRTALIPADVLRLPLIDTKLNPMHWADWCRLNRLRLPEAPRPSFDRGSMAVAAAVDHVGVVLETTRFAEAELARGDLVILDGPTFRRIERETHFLCWRRAERDAPAVQAFREWLHQQLAQTGSKEPD